jgi:AbiV family abortive infection protein
VDTTRTRGKGSKKLDDFRPLFDENFDHTDILDQIKQIGFYTDCLGNAHWAIPEAIIDESLARTIFSIADILAQDKQVTPLEIEL